MAIQLGFVVIGRNEGERLERCLSAIRQYSPESTIVYVDSGSEDDSIGFASSIGAHVVELDTSVPFTAARARNAGFEQLMVVAPQLKYVQFLDGDCEMERGWVKFALEECERQPEFGIVSGRRLEKNQKASVYNRLMDVEWNTPVGEIKAVLGDMLVRTELFKKIGGFSAGILAAEDDDFCIRARAAGYKVFRLDCPMSRHDANILTLKQWYKRAVRGGYGFANIYHLHGRGSEKYFARELLSTLIWGLMIPVFFVLCIFFAPILALAVPMLYGASIAKMVLGRLGKEQGRITAMKYGFLVLTGKVPEFIGAFSYFYNQLSNRRQELIEYK